MHNTATDSTLKRKFGESIAQSIPTIIGAFKGAVTRQINQFADAPEHSIWQRNYYQHVIRDEMSLSEIREYVLYNPASWDADSLYTVS